MAVQVDIEVYSNNTHAKIILTSQQPLYPSYPAGPALKLKTSEKTPSQLQEQAVVNIHQSQTASTGRISQKVTILSSPRAGGVDGPTMMGCSDGRLAPTNCSGDSVDDVDSGE